jgi:tRNA/tmRNA/rRNA uracil-C5-methylase (TrmA/RlmC/RlmD family)
MAEAVESNGLLVGQRINLDVGRIAHGGHFIAHSHGFTIFVRGGVKGERVVAEVTEVKKRIAMADVVEVIERSPHRVEAPCQYFRDQACGGCDFQHIELPYQRSLKAEVVKESFRRIAGIEIEVDCLAAEGERDGFHWRTRMDFTLTPSRNVALHPHHSDSLTEIDRCLIAGDGIDIKKINELAHVRSIAPFERVRVGTDRNGEMMLSGKVEMEVKGKRFPISTDSFWQPHRGAATTLVGAVMKVMPLSEGEHVLDLYGGVGLFAAFLRDRVGENGRVSLVESDEISLQDARAIFKGDVRVKVISARVEEALKKIDRCDRVLLDPPRSGVGAKVLDGLTRLGAKQILYISCDPATLARDAKGLVERGYRLDSVIAYDLFPMTEHIESVANFIKG